VRVEYVVVPVAVSKTHGGDPCFASSEQQVDELVLGLAQSDSRPEVREIDGDGHPCNLLTQVEQMELSSVGASCDLGDSGTLSGTAADRFEKGAMEVSVGACENGDGAFMRACENGEGIPMSACENLEAAATDIAVCEKGNSGTGVLSSSLYMVLVGPSAGEKGELDVSFDIAAEGGTRDVSDKEDLASSHSSGLEGLSVFDDEGYEASEDERPPFDPKFPHLTWRDVCAAMVTNRGSYESMMARRQC
jgi:hypothetical protein